MINKKLKSQLEQIRYTNNKGFTLMEMLLVIFMFSVIMMGLQYTLVAAFRSVDDIKAYSIYQGAPERNFHFIKNLIQRNQKKIYTMNAFHIINSGEGIRMQLDTPEGEKYTYAYVMLSNVPGREDELYYMVSTSPIVTEITEAMINDGRALLLAEDMYEIRFVLSSDGLLSIQQTFLVGAHEDEEVDLGKALIDIKEMKLYVQ